MSIKVQEGREMQENYVEDEAVLTSYMHDMRAAREDADRELAHMRTMAESAHKDWMRKLKDRRKEVSPALSAHVPFLSVHQGWQLTSDLERPHVAIQQALSATLHCTLAAAISFRSTICIRILAGSDAALRAGHFF